MEQRDYGKLKVINVGGHPSERKQWSAHFDGLSAVIFVASLSCYDETTMDGNRRTNRMTESLALFGEILSDEKLQNVPIVLLLNKTDLSKEKIQRVPLAICDSFASYDGPPRSYEHGLEYIHRMFLSLDVAINNPRSRIISRYINALDYDQIGKVWKDIRRHAVERKHDPNLL